MAMGRHCLRDPRFSRLGRTPICDRQTDGQTHDDNTYRACIASRGKNGLRDPDDAPFRGGLSYLG